jgi:hypothetical protein
MSQRRFQLLPLKACFEFIAHAPLPAPPPNWPLRPGDVARDAAGRARLVHFAPGRWLAPAPDAALVTELSALERAAAGTLVEVSGKWCAVALEASLGKAVLASAIDVEAVLAGREAAAVMLFECPAVLARGALGYDLWVGASYLHALGTVVDALRIAG